MGAESTPSNASGSTGMYTCVQHKGYSNSVNTCGLGTKGKVHQTFTKVKVYKTPKRANGTSERIKQDIKTGTLHTKKVDRAPTKVHKVIKKVLKASKEVHKT